VNRLLDSDILIDNLRGLEEARVLLEQLGEEGEPRASILTRAELRSGLRGSDPEVDVLLSRITWEHVTEEITDRAGEFARAYGPSHPGIGLVDYLVAATADVLGLDLTTRNVRHFPMFPDLRPPY
jgi:predicted nucleic acid-binding protein